MFRCARARVSVKETFEVRSEVRTRDLDDVKREGVAYRALAVTYRSITQPRVILITAAQHAILGSQLFGVKAGEQKVETPLLKLAFFGEKQLCRLFEFAAVDFFFFEIREAFNAICSLVFGPISAHSCIPGISHFLPAVRTSDTGTLIISLIPIHAFSRFGRR